MNNDLLWIVFAIINFVLLLIMYRLFGRLGLFVWVGMATVLANIQVTKTIELFGLTATMGNIIYGTIFLASDILNENHGKKIARKAVGLGFSTLIIMTIIMQIVLVFDPAPSDIANSSLSTIFGFLPRVALGSLIAYGISQYVDVWLYALVKRMLPNDKYLWVRNNGSTMLSQLLDTLVFCTIAFAGTYEWSVWIEIFISTYLLKFVVSIISTPFLYGAKRMYKQIND
ncbi:queuosine precursor transporter [Terribacillus saccharophilus]|uniref:queuosine precursor transporter n=1 Tax=Terribacillus saccharophilus TaxID=361277 RepID=UPI002DC4A24B|nr:queuosine precursor transporter [Terribacillus saccharophilus]